MYNFIIKPLLFKFSPEKAHAIIVAIIRLPFVKMILGALFNFRDERLGTEVAGLHFKNRIGLAAGFDKNASLIREMASLGFGFIEIGTITPLGQPGNPKPRIFRLPEDQALVNRMGFNNLGVDAAISKLKKIKKKNLIIGGNIGKNKITPLENAKEDYLICFTKLFPYVDYFTVNVSSPNTPNLRELQDKKPLTDILGSLQKLNLTKEKPKPIFLKIAPDVSFEQLDDIIDIVQQTGISGIVATNTTISREGLVTSAHTVEMIGSGGLSGLPLKHRSTEIIRYIVQRSNGSIPVIGIGGIQSAEDAIEKLEAGASLLQIYTGFIYEGPALVKRINKVLVKFQT
ncbi:MAG TPA: quinone-dependent dihydroorotate dehydrogenase [Saprospiraceae bacterium]|nr:dihydroorotate dehydrogenase (quinone) [Saprospirales bacterium]HRQ28501.1 quinone-dependent dihydroorotate dehydrogenase [Saprospiraceae bacterium]